MLLDALNVNWFQRVTNKELNNDFSKVTETVRYRRLKFLEHIWRHDEELPATCFFLMPTNGKNKRRRPQKRYIDQLIENTGLQMEEIKILMANREEWKSVINSNFPNRFYQ